MSAINFMKQIACEKFANISIKSNKQKEDKKTRFSHGKHVIMISGNYKGYNGFVYDFYPERLNVEVEEFSYILAESEFKIGAEIMTHFGKSKIVSKVDPMFKIVCENNQEINLPKYCFIRLVLFIENGILKIAQYLKDVGNMKREMVVLNLTYDKSCDKTDLVKIVSDALVSGCYRELYGETIVKHDVDCSTEYYMVCQSPMNKGEKNYFGKYGKLLSKVPQQYFINYKHVVKLQTGSVSFVEGNNVIIQKGIYKNKRGKVVSTECATLNIQIDAIGKMINEHVVKNTIRKIRNDDVFYCDFKLKNGNYFQVVECKNRDSIFVGMEMQVSGIISSTICSKDIMEVMPGFTILNSGSMTVITEETEETEDTEDTEDMIVMDSIETAMEQMDIDDDESEVDGYADVDVVETVEMENYQYENKEGQMKETFKDTERSSFGQRTLSKDEKEYVKMIEKCMIMGDVNIYSLLDRVNDAVEKMKLELKKIDVLSWKSTDVKYIVTCLVAYEIIRNGNSMSSYDFRDYITKLYESGYFTKNSILNTEFIRDDEKIDNMESCLYFIQEERTNMKKLFKESKFLDIVRIIVKNCDYLLQLWFGKVMFIENKKIEFIPVSKPNTIREYPKYFLTTDDIVKDVTVDTAKRIMWGPESKKLINVWKGILDQRLQKEKNETAKELYSFVRDNLENAPFVLRELELSGDKLDQLKYRELKRSFESFSGKLKIHVEKKKQIRLADLEILTLEKDNFNKRRLEISNSKDVDSLFMDDLKISEKPLEKKKKIRVN